MPLMESSLCSFVQVSEIYRAVCSSSIDFKPRSVIPSEHFRDKPGYIFEFITHEDC
jgi:hypothetical protein